MKQLQWLTKKVLVDQKLFQALLEFKELTHEEALNEVKTLKSIEQKDEVSKPKENIFEKLTDAQGRQLHLQLTEVDK